MAAVKQEKTGVKSEDKKVFTTEEFRAADQHLDHERRASQIESATKNTTSEEKVSESYANFMYIMENTGITRDSLTSKSNLQDISAVAPELKEAVDLMQALRDKNTLDAEIAKYHLEVGINWLQSNKKEIHELIHRENRAMLPVEKAFITEISNSLLESRAKMIEIPKKSPEAFYHIHGETILGYARDLRNGKLVITPYVEKNLETLLDNLQEGKITFIHGETGSGKTEIAKLAAQLHSKKEAVLVRGYPGMSSEEMFGHMKLSSTGTDLSEIPKKIDQAITNWEKQNPGASEEESSKAKQQIVDAATSSHEATITEFVLRGVYQAASEGRIVIFDEANYIPSGLRAKLNEIMTLRVGEKLYTQENGQEPIIIQEGYGMIFTGNLDYQNSLKKYGDRLPLGVAFQNRIRVMEHDFLPQTTTGSYDVVTSASQKEQFAIAVARVLNEDGIAAIPENGLEELWRLSQFAKHTQDAFSGRIKQGDPMSFQRGGSSIQVVPEICISPRVLADIVDKWAKGNESMSNCIYEVFVDSAIKTSDKAYIYYLAQQCGFFKAPEWPEPKYSAQGEITHFPVKNTFVPQAPLEIITKEDVIHAIFGAPPQRTVFPVENKVETVAKNHSAAYANMEQKIAEMKKRLNQTPGTPKQN